MADYRVSKDLALRRVRVTLRVLVAATGAYVAFHSVLAMAQTDVTNLGGDLSSDLAGRHAIQVAAPNVTSAERIAEQSAGFPLFHRSTKRSEGLGPRFLNNSCTGCHNDNGRGPTVFDNAPRRGSSMVVKIKPQGLAADGSVPTVPGFGSQLLDHSISGDRSRSIELSWRTVTGRYADGSLYQLRKPVLKFSDGIRLPKGTIVSLRMSPPLIGMGLLEAIPSSSIVALSDVNDTDKDGVSGRPNFVKNKVTGNYSIGRFGFKGTQPSVVQQTAAAFYHDMQVTNSLFFDREGASEASDTELHSLAVYLKLAGVPKAREQESTVVQEGKSIFSEISCDACHRMTFTTGANHPDLELRNQTIHPFTDLLLHDMGASLADGWNEFSANGREWRTTPLWGIGFSARLARGKATFLHDGRARSIEEAILWHGGEAYRSKHAFVNLPQPKREALLAFLDSL